MGVACRKLPRPRRSIQCTNLRILAFDQKLQRRPQFVRAAEQRNDFLRSILDQLQMAGQQIERRQKIRVNLPMLLHEIRRAR